MSSSWTTALVLTSTGRRRHAVSWSAFYFVIGGKTEYCGLSLSEAKSSYIKLQADRVSVSGWKCSIQYGVGNMLVDFDAVCNVFLEWHDLSNALINSEIRC